MMKLVSISGFFFLFFKFLFLVEENEGRISEESDESTEIEEFPTENDTKTEQNPPTLIYSESPLSLSVLLIFCFRWVDVY